MKKKAFTLVELLVVIAIIAMLLAILMPALSKVREMAYRMVCGTNLSGIGKAMLTYSQDYDEAFPIAGGISTTWSVDGTLGTPWQWDDPQTAPDKGSAATISASLYLLIKYGDLSPSQFICKATQDKKFDLADYSTRNTRCTDLRTAWDFGVKETSPIIKGPWNHVSYSYHQPYCPKYPQYVAHSSSSPALAILADRNRWYDTSIDTTARNGLKALKVDETTGELESTKNTEQANSLNHGSEGQNVMYADTHVDFSKTPNVGIDKDNIYTRWDVAVGKVPTLLQETQGGKISAALPTDQVYSLPASATDSFLVSDYITQ